LPVLCSARRIPYLLRPAAFRRQTSAQPGLLQTSDKCQPNAPKPAWRGDSLALAQRAPRGLVAQLVTRRANSRKERISDPCFHPTRFLRTFAVLQFSKFGRRARAARTHAGTHTRAHARALARARARSRARPARARTRIRARMRAQARAQLQTRMRAQRGAHTHRYIGPRRVPSPPAATRVGGPGDAFPRRVQGECAGWVTGAQRHEWSSGRPHGAIDVTRFRFPADALAGLLGQWGIRSGAHSATSSNTHQQLRQKHMDQVTNSVNCWKVLALAGRNTRKPGVACGPATQGVA
jgi:hypothetical protein